MVDKLFFSIVGLVTVCALGLMVWAISGAVDHEHRLMVECMADGKKEYECYAMMKQDIVPMPIVIPTNG